MRLVLLSGGSGKRLWPLSNNSRSKQFIKALLNEEGEYESMIQRVWRQIEAAGLNQNISIATSKTQKEILINQLGHNVDIIVEPERRDTFAAIALASLFLYKKKNVDLNEIIVVLPVDPFVENEFFGMIKQMEIAIQETNADLALLGVLPTYPSEKYGYIIPKQKYSDFFFQVDYFKEKPTECEAESLIKNNALWNCGVFAFRLGYIISILKEKKLSLEYELFLKNYNHIPKNSFDYEVVENTENIIVIPYRGYWKDIGTWNTFTEELSDSVLGKGFINSDILNHNNHIVNELDIPIALVGLTDVVVAASPDGILVSTKEASSQVKEIANKFDGRLMYEERRWGWYRVLDHTVQEDQKEILTRKIHLSSGKNLSYHSHDKRIEIWIVLNGQGECIIEGEKIYIKAGDTLKIDKKMKHALKALSDLEFIETQIGTELSESDIKRYYLEWYEIIEKIIK
ncbi:sugar phosphate nucleotidyltransferase [Paenibacillus sp. MSJ-34]|uniref:sugar phosphate nucleotidyltransferase n=1 Tax=Paenibacillus sp. MSJ-34 TaxID=2841529 RepID=UPI001C10705D|nr:sugar phosphate nucleotidyltransferase [Paenibacillus sp. MSJ-34]MBU5444370.1 cupin domain-containing protein [Paenibacillus sp. MSJ-34]